MLALRTIHTLTALSVCTLLTGACQFSVKSSTQDDDRQADDDDGTPATTDADGGQTPDDDDDTGRDASVDSDDDNANDDAGAGDARDGGAANEGDGGHADAGRSNASDAGTDGGAQALPSVEEVATIGVGVSGDLFCSEGSFTVTVQPRDADGKLVTPRLEQLQCSAELGGNPVDCAVDSVACDAGSQGTSNKTVVLVIVDDSGSMNDNDPERLRGQACQAFVERLGEADYVAVTDFGHGGTSPSQALRTLQGATDDKDAATAACNSIASGPTGTPIYRSVVDAVEVFYPAAKEAHGSGVNFSVLMLSDGEPESDLATREEALAASRQAHIPIFTVGLGPAAEGSDDSDANAVSVLQELSQETGGAFASSVDADGLQGLFEQVGSVVREGSCQVAATLKVGAFVTGEQVEGYLLFGDDVETPFGFTVPTTDLDASRCN